MTEKQCEERLYYCRSFIEAANRICLESNSDLYYDATFKSCIKKTRKEIAKLEELLYNRECEDSEQQLELDL